MRKNESARTEYIPVRGNGLVSQGDVYRIKHQSWAWRVFEATLSSFSRALREGPLDHSITRRIRAQPAAGAPKNTHNAARIQPSSARRCRLKEVVEL